MAGRPVPHVDGRGETPGCGGGRRREEREVETGSVGADGDAGVVRRRGEGEAVKPQETTSNFQTKNGENWTGLKLYRGIIIILHPLLVFVLSPGTAFFCGTEGVWRKWMWSCSLKFLFFSFF